MITDLAWEEYLNDCLCPKCGKDEITHCDCDDNMQVVVLDIEPSNIKQDPRKLVEEIQQFRDKMKELIK